jgi:hypothetical protein
MDDYTGAINEMDAPPISRLPTRMPQSSSTTLTMGNIIMPSQPSQPQQSSATQLGFFPKNITPDMPTHPSSPSCNETGGAASCMGSGENYPPPPAFASFLGSRFSSQVIDAAASWQPRSLKNPDVLHYHDRPPSEDSTHESPIRKIPSIISTQLEPSSPLMMSPMVGGMSPEKSPNKKRSMEGRDDFSNRPENEQPSTPKYRCLLQHLSLNSPARSSASCTPEEAGGSVEQPYRRPPNIPSFVKNKKDCIMPTESFESQSFSAANSPMGTPERGPFFIRSSEKISTPTTVSSSFHSVRSNRTSIGHQNSPFKMIPPRLGLERDQSQGSNDPLDVFHSSTSPFMSSPTRFASSSAFASSPSPRVVPLKILSRDGSPVGNAKLASATGIIPKLGTDHLPYVSSTNPQAIMSSPLMRSLDVFAKKISMKQMANVDGRQDKLSGAAMPSIYGASPKSSKDFLQLPRIKLTPRSKSNCASLMLDLSPRGEAAPCLNLLPSSRPLDKKRIEKSGDKEDAEMDSLLSGFGHHNNAGDDEPRNAKQWRSNDLLGRVESEESEMVAIAQAPLLFPSFCTQAKERKEVHFETSCSQLKPMKSITFKSPKHDRDESLGSPSFLPRFVPAAKSRSLFNSSHAYDPFDQILRADAIAEAAKSNEELTDDESDSEGPGSDFLLCSPKANASKTLHKMEKRPSRGANYTPVKSGYRAESPSFGRSRASSIGSLKKKTRSFSSPFTPTIAEEGLASFDAILSKSSTCSLSDCDDTTASHYLSHPMSSIGMGVKTTGLDYRHSSLQSMSSLFGLNIVDESADELRDVVSALLPSESSQVFKSEDSDMGGVGLRRSECSQNSLGLSVDSVCDTDQRDLFTPPITTVRSLQSPPPLPKRAQNYNYF